MVLVHIEKTVSHGPRLCLPPTPDLSALFTSCNLTPLCAPSAFAFAHKYGRSDPTLYHFCTFPQLMTNFMYYSRVRVDITKLLVEFHPSVSHPTSGARSFLQETNSYPLRISICDRGRHGTCNSLCGLEHSRRGFASHHQLLTMDR